MALTLHGNNGLGTTNGTAAAPSLAAPDTDTGLFFGTNLIHATTNGTTRLSIIADGKVGIGITNPGAELHAYHATSNTIAQFESGDAGAGAIWKDNSTYSSIEQNGTDFIISADQAASHANSALSFKVDTSETLRINSGGRVNIGHLNQTGSQLDYTRVNIYGQTSSGGTNKNLNLLNVYNYGSGGVGDITGIGLGAGASPGSYTKASIGFIRTTTYGRGDIIFCINDQGNTNPVVEANERLRIAKNGQVCIGEGFKSSGGGQLTIRGLGVNAYAVQDYQYIGTPSGANTTLAQIRFTANTTGSSVIQGARIQARSDAAWSGTGDAPTRLEFWTAPNGSASTEQRMAIMSNGSVNIGSGQLDQTDRLLNVYGGRIRISGLPNNSNSLEIYASATTGQSHGIMCQAGTNASDINSTFRNTSGTTLFRIRGDGNIGVGVDAPSRKVHIKNTGIIKLENTSTGGWLGLEFLGSSGTNNYDGYMGLQDSDGLFFLDNNSNGHDFAITQAGQLRIPQNGAQLCWGASQQFKMYWENSEDRMYLQGDGAYGMAFRVNGGNRLEINKTTGDVTMQGASGRNFNWDNSDASLYLTDNGSGASARLKVGSGGDLQIYHDVSGMNHITCANNHELKLSALKFSVYDYTGGTQRLTIEDTHPTFILGNATSKSFQVRKNGTLNTASLQCIASFWHSGGTTSSDKRYIGISSSPDGVYGCHVGSYNDGTNPGWLQPGFYVATGHNSYLPNDHSIRFKISSNGNFYGSSTTISSISDARLKKNITNYTYDLNKFKQLQPKTFEWINPAEHCDDVKRGFSAQEVEAVDDYWILEDRVDKDSKDKDLLDSDRIAKNSKLGELDAMYVSVINQLIAKIETLETKVAALEGS